MNYESNHKQMSRTSQKLKVPNYFLKGYSETLKGQEGEEMRPGRWRKGQALATQV